MTVLRINKEDIFDTTGTKMTGADLVYCEGEIRQQVDIIQHGAEWMKEVGRAF